MPKENIIPKVEIVSEVKNKYQVLSYEEFLRTYESRTNYTDLDGGEVGAPKIYGPGDKDNGFQVRVEPNIDAVSSISLGGVEVEVAGLGFGIGKKTGISTSLGEIAVGFKKFVVQ